MDATHCPQEKAKARKSGPSVLNKTKNLAKKANIFAACVYWDPTHFCYRVTAWLPPGEVVPDLNQLIADELSRHEACSSPEHPSEPQSQRVTRPQGTKRKRPLRRSARHSKKRQHETSHDDSDSSYSFCDVVDGAIQMADGDPISASAVVVEHTRHQNTDDQAALNTPGLATQEAQCAAPLGDLEQQDAEWPELDYAFMRHSSVPETASESVLDAIFLDHTPLEEDLSMAHSNSEPQVPPEKPVMRATFVPDENWKKLARHTIESITRILQCA